MHPTKADARHQPRLPGSGEMHDRIVGFDWSRTSVGPIEKWSPSFRTAVEILLTAAQPMTICWGPEYTFLYNDAYRPILGKVKHPALGRPTRECFAEIWHVVGPLFDSVMATGDAVWREDQLYPLWRDEHLEECTFTFSYSPIFERDGRVGGIFVTCIETTEKVVSNRRAATLHELSSQTAGSETAAEVVRNAAAVLRANPLDVPFALFYRFEPGEARLVEAVGIKAGSAAAPLALPAGSADQPWPIARAALGEQIVIERFADECGEIFAPEWPESVRAAIVAPLPPFDAGSEVGALVLGVTPRRALDDGARAFAALVRAAIASRLSECAVVEEVRQRVAAQEYAVEILESMTDAFYATDGEWRFTYVNHAAEKALARNRRELVGKNVWSEFPVEMIGRSLQEELQAAMRERRTASGLYYFKALDVWFDYQVYPTRGGLSVFFRDVTASKRAADEMRRSQAHFKALIDHSFDGVALLGRDAAIRYVSPAGARLLGLSTPQLAGRSAFDLIHPEDTPRAHRELAELLAIPGGNVSSRFRFAAEGGRWSWLEGRATNLLEDPDVGAIVFNFQDVTQRIVAEQALEARERLFRALVEKSWDAIALVDDQGRLLYLSPSTERLLGRRPQDLIDHDGFENIHPADLPACRKSFAKLVAESGATFTVRYRQRHATAGWVWLETTATNLLHDPAVSAIVLNFRDVTALTLAEIDQQNLLEREREARQLAESANRAKDDFLAMLSHELRSPVSAVLMWTQLLRSARLDGSKVTRALEAIERNSGMQARLIEDLLDVSRIVAGKLTLELADVDLAAVIEAAVGGLRDAADKKGVRLECAIEAPPYVVHGDAVRFQQVFANLVSNAIKFTPRDGSVKLALRRTGDAVEVVVADTGIGIRPDVIGSIFERFQQADNSITRHYGGLGLGLAIAKYLVEAHGGRILAESAGEGQGATFRVHLPIAALAARAGSVPAVAVGVAGVGAFGPLRSIKVLVVDDDRDGRAAVAGALRESGAVVTEASSIDQGLALVRSELPNVVVTDLAMPGNSGWSLLRAIREIDLARRTSTVAVALTAVAPNSEESSVGASFDLYLVKPMAATEVVARLAELLFSVEQAAGAE